MGNFKYKAINNLGERIEGVLQGSSKEEVLEMIAANSYYPLMIEETIESTKIELSKFQRISTKELAIFCRQLFTMINAGLPITATIEILGQQAVNKKLKGALEDMQDSLRKGESLSSAMKNTDAFPDLLISMIQSGEVSGNLDGVTLRMATHYEKENKINNKVKNTMIYPIVLGILAVVIINVLLVFVMPLFIEMFQQSGAELPLPTKIVMGLSNFTTDYWYVILGTIIASVYILTKYFKTNKGKTLWGRIKLKAPLLKPLNEKIIVSRFTRTLSTLLSSGISLVQALSVVGAVLGNKVAEEKLLSIREEVIKGNGLSGPMGQAGIFPPMLSVMIRVGEESGNLDDILSKTADFYDEELEAQIQSFTAMLEPLMIIIMGVIAGFLIVSIALPMFSMYQMV